MNYENLKTRTNQGITFIRSHATLITFGFLLLVILFINFQQYLDRRAERIENEKIKVFETELAQQRQVFQSILEMANKDHETTTVILDAISIQSKLLNQLAQNDATITARVDFISEGEYKNARNQKNNQKAVANGTARSSRPLRQREQSALANDRELYPDN